MAKPQPLPSDEREPKEIADFRAAYAQSLEHARISAEHTATEGWKNLYAAHRDKIRKGQDDLADHLTRLTETIRQRLLSEDEEKEVKDAAKGLSELREASESFQRQVIDPIIAPMIECHAVIESARATARESERTAPLHTRGLVDAMETVIDTQPRVKFMTAAGTLLVGE